MKAPLVLGSASPRRADLLRQIGLDFVQVVSPEEEPPIEGGDPREHVLHSAAAKAAAVRRHVAATRPELRGAPVLGADTVVVLGDTMLGKPDGPGGAASMLRRLSGRGHSVCTGLALFLPGDEGAAPVRECVETRVRFGRLTEGDIAAYVAGGEPLDKAGAYGIQGGGARFIEHIEGCYYNVVGLPLFRLCRILGQAGFDLNAP